jgi:manganese/zinc/iron transport system permease protein
MAGWALLGLTVTQKVALGTSLLGGVAGVVGCFAVLRGRSLVGDMLAHAALPGICLAFLLTGQRNMVGMMGGALAAGLLAIALVTLVCHHTRTKHDAAVGIVLSTFFGAGIVLLSVIRHRPVGHKAGLDTFLFGQAASMRNQDLLAIVLVSAVVLATVALLYKELKLVSFDPEFASTQGWPTLALDLVAMSAVALMTVVGLPAVGVVLMAAMIIFPGTAARFWTDSWGRMLWIAGGIGGLAGLLGTWLSSHPPAILVGRNTANSLRGGLPTGPMIVLTGTAMFAISVLVAPRRGTIARLLEHWSLVRRIERENFLSALHELSRSGQARPAALTAAAVADRIGSTIHHATRALHRARREGLVAAVPTGYRLTDRGFAEAAAVVRMHAIWSLYLREGADIDFDATHRDARSIEQLLPAKVIRQLESRLQ